MHAHGGNHAEALTTLKLARELGVWFYRTFTNARFSPGPFVPPPDPSAATKALHEELARLRGIVSEVQSEAEKARLAVEAEARERMTAEERARQESADRAVWEQLAGEAEQAKAALAAQLAALQAAAVQAVPQTTLKLVAKAEAAADEIDIDEASTRALIDAQLAARGWDVDTPTSRMSATGMNSLPFKNSSCAAATASATLGAYSSGLISFSIRPARVML
jgi:type I restriction enzyme R subunit